MTTYLTTDELAALEHHGCSSGTDTPPILRQAIAKACAELRARRAADEPTIESGVHRVTFVILGAQGAVQRVVRRMLDGAGFDQLSFAMSPATQAEIDSRYPPDKPR